MGALKKHHHFGPSRSDSDWRAAKALKTFAGFIFVCSKSNIPDLKRGIFGLPGYYKESVRNIQRGMPLFLLDDTTRRLYGVFEAASDGGYNLDPFAWETNDHPKRRSSNVISKYPAQVKVIVRAERPALEAESYFSILDHVEGSKFRLELTTLQVQQLLCLFDGALVAKNERLAERNGLKNNHRKAKYRKPNSPQSTTKSDSDSYSDCSSRGLNSCEDEWADEVIHDNSLRNGGQERAVSERLAQINLDSCGHHHKCQSKLKVAAEDKVGSADHKKRVGAWKRSVHKPSYPGSDSENLNLSRLQEIDPAVNSNSHHFTQIGVDRSGALNRPDVLGTAPIPQAPFGSSENISMQLAPQQHRETSSQHQTSLIERSMWNERKNVSRGLMNSKKQGFNQERIRKLQDASYQTQEQTSGDIVSAQTHKCQHLDHIQQDSARSAIPSSRVISPKPTDSSCVRRGSSVISEGRQGFNVADDVQELLKELCDVSQNSNLPTFPTTRHPSIPARFDEALHLEILQFARWTRPSLEIQRHAEAAIDCVRKGVKSVWPEADVEVFGSFATGLCLQHSDVDLAVIDAPQISSIESVSVSQASASLIRKLASALQAYEWCESIKPLDTASMPVLKCLCRPFGKLSNTPTKVSTVSVDITIGGIKNSYFSWNPAAQVLDSAECNQLQGKLMTRHTGGAARDYVLHKIHELPALAPLVLLLKSFLHHKNLSNVYLGGLGSFSLTLLVAFYLERFPVIRDFLPNRGAVGSSIPRTPLPVPCLSDLAEDTDAASSSCCQVSANGNLEITCSGHTLGEHYVRTAADTVERVLLFWEQDGSPCLGNLLLGILRIFGFERDFSRDKIILKGLDGSPGGFFDRDDRHVALWIDDPLRPGVNIGAGSFGMVHVQTAFKELLLSLTKCPIFIPTLKCDDKDCQDLLAFSRLVHIGCIVVGDESF